MKYILIMCVAMLAFSCTSEPEEQWVEKDLMEYGVPLVIRAPDSIAVKKSNYAGQTDILVTGTGDYRLQIFSSPATNSRPGDMVQELRENVESNRYFKEVVEEFQDGFIYSLQIDSTHQSFGFRRVLIQGQNEYIIQNDLRGLHSLERAKKLYGVIEE